MESAFNLNQRRKALDSSISLQRLKSNPRVQSISQSFHSNFSPSIVDRLDRISTLGSYDSVTEECIGHSGCVNALDWSCDGDLLATGSDDRNIILWGMGGDYTEETSVSENNRGSGSSIGDGSRRSGRRRGHVDSDQEEPSHHELDKNDRPKIDMRVKSLIETGHRANIFSVKFAPKSSTTLFSCAGDRQVRVFDLNSAISTTINTSRGNSFQPYQKYSDSNVCIRVFRCHRGRAKRIETQFSPDTFLTCSEDGDVREFDLRLKHDCSSSNCPPPIASFPFSLYSISISKVSPWLFVAAGTSPYAYLQDRRMNPRILREEWGVKMRGNDEELLSKCVRRFGIPEMEGDDESEDEDDDEADDDDEDEDGHEDDDEEKRRSSRSRRKKRKIEQSRRERIRNSHITAAKISQHDLEEELILSYSADSIYRFKLSDPQSKINRSRPNLSTRQNRLKESGSSKASISDKLRTVHQEIIEILFPKRLDDESVVLLGAKIKKLTKLQSKIRDQSQGQSQVTTPGGSSRDFSQAEEISFALSKALYSLETSLDSTEAKTLLSPFLEISKSVQEINRLLEEEYIHAFDWEHRNQMMMILDKIWELAEPVVKEGWRNQDEETWREAQMQIDGQVASDPEDSKSDLSQDCQDLSEDSSPTSDTEGSSSDPESCSEDEESGSESDPDGIFARQQNSKSREKFNKSVPIVHPISKHSGHRNIETVKDVNYLGNKDQYIMTGSDDGNFFIYEKDWPVPSSSTAAGSLEDESNGLIGIYKGDESVVNVLQAHPTLPLIAVSGIDDTIKLFGPIKPDGDKWNDRMDYKKEITERNQRMNQSSGDTSGERVNARAFIRFLQNHRVAAGQIEEGDECVIA